VALPATDDFTDSNGTQLTAHSANWTLNTTGVSGDFDIQTNTLCADGEADDYGAHWNADSFNNDQYSEAYHTRPTPSGYAVGVACRLIGSAVRTYYGYLADDNNCYLIKLVAGSGSLLGTGDVWGNGITVRIEAEGTTITPMIGGAEDESIGAQTDGSIASGYAGVCGYSDGTGLRVDNWEGGNLSPGGISVPLDALELAGAALGLTVSPGAVSIALDALTLSGIAQALGVSPGAVQVALDTLALVGAVGVLSVAPGAISVPLDTLALAGLAQSLSVSPGAVQVALDVLGLTGTTQGLTIGTGVIVALDLLGLTGAAQALSISPGAVSVALNALNITGTAQGVSVLKGAVSVALDALALAGSVHPLTVSAGITIALDVLGLSGAVGSLAVVPGATTVELDALNLIAAVLALSVAADLGLIKMPIISSNGIHSAVGGSLIING